MAILGYRFIMNGSQRQKYWYFKCDVCNKTIEEAWPFYQEDGIDLCPECAYKTGKLNTKEYISLQNICVFGKTKVGLNPETNEIEITNHKHFSWEKTLTEYRHTLEYNSWRLSVFERDKFTCQICNKKGGNLEAHHIKEFKKYPKLRYDILNGITLCRKCHREHHRKAKTNG